MFLLGSDMGRDKHSQAAITKDDRTERLAQALRDNLKRRKVRAPAETDIKQGEAPDDERRD